ncbi:MAG: hypothetical protein KAX20_07110 [Candidatus Omnitrophica bacterium]|nr:hypothetical protein [Candidatus Omnitrophota bacterium]
MIKILKIKNAEGSLTQKQGLPSAGTQVENPPKSGNIIPHLDLGGNRKIERR